MMFNQAELMIIALFGVVALLFIFVLVLSLKVRRLRKNYVKMLSGSNGQDLEQVLIDIQSKVSKLQTDSSIHAQALEAINNTMKKMKAKVGIYRYNAFSDHGSDLSFSIAVLDDYKDGFVLTGIHSREDTYIYAKPIQKGQSSYTLTPEEIETINRCSL